MILETFRAEHLHALDVQESQAYLTPYVKPEHAQALEGTYAFTGMHAGRVIIVGGIAELASGRGLLWAYLDRQAGNMFVAVHRAAQRVIDSYEGARIEAAVDCEFAPGHRWIKMLGFELETARMRKYRPDGGDSAMYVRIR